MPVGVTTQFVPLPDEVLQILGLEHLPRTTFLPRQSQSRVICSREAMSVENLPTYQRRAWKIIKCKRDQRRVRFHNHRAPAHQLGGIPDPVTMKSRHQAAGTHRIGYWRAASTDAGASGDSAAVSISCRCKSSSVSRLWISEV